MSLQILPNRSCYGCCISWIRNGARNNPQGETITHFSVTHSNILMNEASPAATSDVTPWTIQMFAQLRQFLPFGLKTRGSRDGDTCNCVDISNLLCLDWSCYSLLTISGLNLHWFSRQLLNSLIDIFSSHCHYSPKSSYSEFLCWFLVQADSDSRGSKYFLWSLRIRRIGPDQPWLSKSEPMYLDLAESVQYWIDQWHYTRGHNSSKMGWSPPLVLPPPHSYCCHWIINYSEGK